MIALGCNCSGYKLKEETKRFLEENEIAYKDFGTFSEEILDDPEAVKAVCRAVQSKEAEGGILISGSGFGMSMIANKYKGLRSVACFSEDSAKRAKAHYNTNVLSMPADFITLLTAIDIIRIWLGSEVLGGRYQDRLAAIEEIEEENMK